MDELRRLEGRWAEALDKDYPLPKGAINAISRGQDPDKYVRDYHTGLRAESVVARVATDLGFSVTDWNWNVEEQNPHDPDMYINGVPVQVKSASTFGASLSWVFQNSAIPLRHICILTCSGVRGSTPRTPRFRIIAVVSPDYIYKNLSLTLNSRFNSEGPEGKKAFYFSSLESIGYKAVKTPRYELPPPPVTEQGRSRFFFDTETYPIRPGRQAPRVVCVQSLGPDGVARLELRDQGIERLRRALESGAIIVAHNTAYDVAATMATAPDLIPLWWKAYNENRVTCTQTREKLYQVAKATGSKPTSLIACLERRKIPHDFVVGDKSSPDAWRTRYHELDGVPVEQWPADAKRYALADLVVKDLYYAQGDVSPDEYRQARAALWLHLMSCRGMRVDPSQARAYLAELDEEYRQVQSRLKSAGLVRSSGQRNLAAARSLMEQAFRSRGMDVPKTDKGHTSLSADDCAGSGNAVLRDYARYTSLTTLKGRVEALLLAGDLPIQPRFNVLVRTGRTSCSAGRVKPRESVLAWGAQVQNMPREPGLRECFVPRPGYLLAACDWSAAELHSLATVCVEKHQSRAMADVLSRGRDPHLYFACDMRGWGYDWALENKKSPEVSEARQTAKAFNFGIPGGLGVNTFRLFASATYGVDLSEKEAREGIDRWKELYDMHKFFAAAAKVSDTQGDIVHLYSDRVRGRPSYTAAANSMFQGHTADMAKSAGWEIASECFGLRPSPLNDAYLWNFVHDEFILEVPESNAEACGERLKSLMETVGEAWCPPCPPRAEVQILERWQK